MAKKSSPKHKHARKSKLGRPKKQFTAAQIKQIDKAAFNQCKDGTIAEFLGIDTETFKVHFQERTKQKRVEGKFWLHQQQFKKAKAGDTAMLCFLGKNYLEQADRHELTGAGGQPIQVQVIENYATKKPNTAHGSNPPT